MRAPALRRAARPLAGLTRSQIRRQHVAPDQPLTQSSTNTPNAASTSESSIAFCFDIDGVLLRGPTPIPGATEALQTLQERRIPFVLLTNGGGKHESERAADLSQKLSISLDSSRLIQSHTPFESMGDEKGLKEKCVLVVGGDGDKCRAVAEAYGYKNVVTPSDIYVAQPGIWPFSGHFIEYHRSIARPLPRPINFASPEDSLKIDAIFVYNDPRDWGLDTQLIIDLMLSREGILGTHSSKNADPSLPNNGYLQDGQPMIHFSNPDLLWASDYPLPRLGQGAFRSILKELWTQLCMKGLGRQGPSLDSNSLSLGKPFRSTYGFAQRRLTELHQELRGSNGGILNRVYMVGDNPLSDIVGANKHNNKIRRGPQWVSMLTRTGVFTGDSVDRPKDFQPKHIVKDVAEAVALGLQQATLSSTGGK